MTLVNQLHYSQTICMSQLILGSLYETLGLVVKTLKTLILRANIHLDLTRYSNDS